MISFKWNPKVLGQAPKNGRCRYVEHCAYRAGVAVVTNLKWHFAGSHRNICDIDASKDSAIPKISAPTNDNVELHSEHKENRLYASSSHSNLKSRQSARPHHIRRWPENQIEEILFVHMKLCGIQCWFCLMNGGCNLNSSNTMYHSIHRLSSGGHCSIFK